MTEVTIENILQEFLQKLGVSFEKVERVPFPAHPLYNVASATDSKRLIGPQGEHLRALNVLVRRIVEQRVGTEESKIMVDVNGYHQVHLREIEQKAKLLADRVRTFHSSAELSPMNAYERMIIHAMFTDDPDITTESEGTGLMRRVILKYKEQG